MQCARDTLRGMLAARTPKVRRGRADVKPAVPYVVMLYSHNVHSLCRLSRSHFAHTGTTCLLQAAPFVWTLRLLRGSSFTNRVSNSLGDEHSR
jgi:hypothetical protein